MQGIFQSGLAEVWLNVYVITMFEKPIKTFDGESVFRRLVFASTSRARLVGQSERASDRVVALVDGVVHECDVGDDLFSQVAFPGIRALYRASFEFENVVHS